MPEPEQYRYLHRADLVKTLAVRDIEIQEIIQKAADQNGHLIAEMALNEKLKRFIRDIGTEISNHQTTQDMDQNELLNYILSQCKKRT